MPRRDVFSKGQRSAVMSKIRSKGSKLDRTMERLLKQAGLDFETYPKLFGNPDFLVKPNVVVFCDSAFWHGRNWPELRRKLRRSPDPGYWVAHIERNIQRDRAVTRELRRMGFRVVRLWDDVVLRRPSVAVARVVRVMQARPPTVSRTQTWPA